MSSIVHCQATHFANVADAVEFVLTLDIWADLFEVDGVMTYRGYRASIPTDGFMADGRSRLSTYRPERHVVKREVKVLRKGESVRIA